jgi:hypothetical protein
LSTRLKPEDLADRISCFGEFEKSDPICLLHCGLNFECAATHERMLSLDFSEDELPVLRRTYMV